MLTCLKTQSYNICLLLQETHFTEEHIENIKKEWDGEVYFFSVKQNQTQRGFAYYLVQVVLY